MAQLRKVTPSPVLSNFRQAAPSTGYGFRVLAGAMEELYRNLEPAAIEEQRQNGAALGHEMSGGAMPSIMPATGGSDSLSGGINESLAATESGGDYSVVNREGYTGKYQWGQARLDDYNRANGTSFTLEQFRANPGLQERAQEWHVQDIMSQTGDLVGRTVNGITMTPAAIVAMSHLGGIGGARRFVETNGAYNPQDSNGTSLSDYAVRHGGASVGTDSLAGGGGTDTIAPTMIRKGDGSLEAKLYPPTASPILQAHNAAAQVAYQADMMVKGAADLSALYSQFPLDPEGFLAAAQGYVSEAVQGAPDMFREDLRAELESEAVRRYMGIVDDRQSDIRQRADNSSQALIELWSDNLTAAIASGNQTEIAAAQEKLDSILVARESLPGVGWTPANSELVRQRARTAGESRIRATGETADAKAKADLALAIEAAKQGQTAAAEAALLADPSIAARFPDQYEQLQALSTLRATLPGFVSSPAQARAAALAEANAQPVEGRGDLASRAALDEVNRTVTTAFQKDPITAAATYLPNKPPPIPDANTPPEQAVQMLQARKAYADKLVADGFAPKVAYLSSQEAELIGSFFSKEAPVEARLAAAEMVTRGFGPAAPQVFSVLKNVDQTTKAAGMMSAATGNRDVAMEAMMGRAMLDAGQSKNSFKYGSVRTVDPQIATALTGVPVPEGDVLALAAGIMAYNYPEGFTKEQETARAAAAKDALSRALGQTTLPTGEVVGGVQKALGFETLLPGDVSAEDVDAAFGMGFWSAPTGIFSTAGLGKSAGSRPMLGGVPLEPKDLASGNIRLLVAPGWGKDAYLMLYNGEPVRNAAGTTFVFDLRKLTGK